MLRACKRVLKPGGRTAFFTIVVSPGLSKRDHRIAVRLGPSAITMRRPVGDLMDQAGFTETEVVDVSKGFLESARAWVKEFLTHQVELRAAMGEELDERIYDSRDKVRGVEDGLLQRLLVIARAPS